MSDSQWQTITMISFEPPKLKNSHTLKDWVLENKCTFQSSVGLQHLADDLIAKSDQIQDIAVEVIKSNKEETDHCLQEKIKDIEYHMNEIKLKQVEVIKELDILGVYKKRLSDTLTSVSKNIVEVDEKCLQLRENRQGIDLVEDEVKKELLREIDMVKEVTKLLRSVFEDTKERYRKLKVALHFLDRDMLEKNENLHNNQYTLNLRDRDLTLKCGMKFNCSQSDTTLKQWEYQTVKSLNDVTNEIKLSHALRDYIDEITKDSVNDLVVQIHQTNDAFLKRIDETKKEKANLESYHADILVKANEMEKNIKNLEKSITDKEGSLALAQTRLNTHCKGSNVENTRDPVEMNLVKEIRYMNEIVTKLHQTIIQAQESHRSLLKKQIKLEEDINIKVNTLKIDEVDCTALRTTIDIHAY